MTSKDMILSKAFPVMQVRSWLTPCWSSSLFVCGGIGGYILYGGRLSGGDADIGIDLDLPAAK